jgi:hypothetical protein
MASHQVLIFNPSGNYVGDLTGASTKFRYVKAVNDMGFFELSASPHEWPQEWRGTDFQYHFWRRPNGGEWKLDFVGLARDAFGETSNGISVRSFEGFGVNEVLARRIVAYRAGTAGASKTDYLDDMCKAVVYDNLGAGAGDGRNIADVFRLSIAPDLSDAPSVTKAFAYDNVLEVLQSLCDTSAGQASGAVDLFFDIVCTGYNGFRQPTFEFRTYTGQPGVDRTDNGSNLSAVVFSLENGNIDNVRHQRIFSEERNYIYAGGLGLEDDRNVQEASDAARIGVSPINRRELFVSATHLEDAEAIEAAYEALNENRPTRKITCDLQDTDTTPYGVAWDWGDKVTVIYGANKFDEVVRVVEVSVDGNKKETIRGQFGYGQTMGNSLAPIMRKLKALERDFKRAVGAGAEFAKYMGEKSSDFSTTDLPREGQYGYQTNDQYLQINLGGVIRTIALDA